MSTSYIRTYKVGDTEYGIEDYEDGKPDTDHFFPNHYKEGKAQRFHLWRGGCGCGQAKTLAEAEDKLRGYIRNELLIAIDKHKTALEFWQNAFNTFDKYGLGKFGV